MHTTSLRVWVLIMLFGDYLIHLFVEDAILKCRLQNINVASLLTDLTFNLLMPNGHYMGRSAQITSRCCILYFIQQIYILNILNMLYNLRFSLQNAIYFIKLTFLVPVLFTF